MVFLMHKEEEVSVKTYILTTCVSCSVLTLICGIFIYYIYGIMFLVTYYQTCKDCNKSNLWEYILSSLVLGFLRTNIKNIDNNNNNNNNTNINPLCIVICLGLLDVGLGSWGGIELWIKSCDYLVNTNIWTFGVITFGIQTTCSVFALLVVPCGIACFVKQITNLDTDNHSIV